MDNYNLGKYDPTQWQHLVEDNVLNRKNSSFSFSAPSSDILQSSVTGASHLGTFFCAIAACLFSSPLLIRTDCSYHNVTGNGYNSTQNYDCNMSSVIQHGVISGGAGLGLCLFFFAITGYNKLGSHRVQDDDVEQGKTNSRQPLEDSESISLIEKSTSLSCFAPAPDKLHSFVKTVLPHLGTVVLGMAVTLFAAPGVIKIGCGLHNGTEIDYNNTETYDCNMDSFAPLSVIGGAAFGAAGLFMYIIALVLYKWNGSVGRNRSVIEYGGEANYVGIRKNNEGDGKATLTKEQSVKYLKKYIDVYTTKFGEEFEKAYQFVCATMNYEQEQAKAYAKDNANQKTKEYLSKEALKYANKIDPYIQSGGSEGISLENNQEIDSSHMNEYRDAYLTKFCEEFEGEHKNAYFTLKCNDSKERAMKGAKETVENDETIQRKNNLQTDNPYMKKYIEAYIARFCNEYENAHKFSHRTKLYEDPAKRIPIIAAAKEDAKKYADILIDAPLNFPHCYRHQYRDQYSKKFTELYKVGKTEETQRMARQYAETSARDAVEDRIKQNIDGSFVDEEMSI